LDNDASPATSALRSTASVRYTNLFQKGQTANITYITAPLNWREVQVVAGSYSIPLLQSPWSINISGYYSNSNVAAGGGSSVLGAGYQVGVRAQYVIAGESSQQTFSFGPDFKDFKQKIAVGNALASSAPIRYIPFELAYALSGASEHSNFAVSLSTTVGLRTIKGSVCVDNAGTCLPSDPFRNREANSNENFLRTDLSLDYSYALANDTIAAMRVTGRSGGRQWHCRQSRTALAILRAAFRPVADRGAVLRLCGQRVFAGVAAFALGHLKLQPDRCGWGSIRAAVQAIFKPVAGRCRAA